MYQRTILLQAILELWRHSFESGHQHPDAVDVGRQGLDGGLRRRHQQQPAEHQWRVSRAQRVRRSC